MSFALQYWLAVATLGLLGAGSCVVARRRPSTAGWVGRIIGLGLGLDAVVFVTRPALNGTWTAAGSLPLALCDVALVVAAVACWVPGWRLGFELTYFWGLAGTAQAVATPDLSVGITHLAFAEFVVGHVGIVLAVGYLLGVARCRPRPGAPLRIFAITLVYTVAVGVVDAVTGGNYMFLAHRPGSASLLSVLGPWPWYLFSATAVAIVLFTILAAPFRRSDRRRRAPRPEVVPLG